MVIGTQARAKISLTANIDFRLKPVSKGDWRRKPAENMMVVQIELENCQEDTFL